MTKGRFKDLTGEKFGAFTVIMRVDKAKENKRTKKDAYWLCRCECGNEMIKISNDIKTKFVKCNICEKNNDPNGVNRMKVIWYGMVKRCTKDGHKNYKGRGIEICQKWLVFQNFYDDMHSGYLKHIAKHGEKNTSIEREDVNKGYNIENCRWATIEEQNMNKRTTILVEINGEMKSLKKISEQTGIQYKTLQYRHKRGKRGAELIAPIKR